MQYPIPEKQNEKKVWSNGADQASSIPFSNTLISGDGEPVFIPGIPVVPLSFGAFAN